MPGRPRSAPTIAAAKKICVGRLSFGLIRPYSLTSSSRASFAAGRKRRAGKMLTGGLTPRRLPKRTVVARTRREPMASPDVLDFAKLTAPTPGDKPTGADLRAEAAPGSTYYAIKD